MRLPEGVRRRGQLLDLPPRAALFFARARRVAAERDDRFSLGSAAGPRSLAYLLRQSRGARRIVEIGTGTAWTAIAAALVDGRRTVVTYDPIVRPERDWYLDLVDDDVRRRIDFRDAPGEQGPRPGDPPVDFLFIDGSHERDRTIATFQAWRSALAPGGRVAFHDWQNDAYPGPTQAIETLGISGHGRGDVFVWRSPG